MAKVPTNLAFVLDTSKIKLRAKRGRKAIMEKLGKMGKIVAHVKPCELLETPNVKDEGNQHPSPKGKVQRLSDYRSTHKCVEAQGSRNTDDIVSTSWKHEDAYLKAA